MLFIACSPNLCLWLKAPNSGFHVNAEYKRCAPLMTRNNANNPAKTREGSHNIGRTVITYHWPARRTDAD
jgi:hypothetical protein